MYKKILMPWEQLQPDGNSRGPGDCQESVPHGVELIEDLKRVGSKALELAQVAGIEAESKLVEARPVEAILSEAKNHDLIVMGTHGRSGLDRFMLGSVTETVLHRSDKPVLVLRCK